MPTTRHPNRSMVLDPTKRLSRSHSSTASRQADASPSTTPATNPDEPRVVVQWLRTEWTKKSRGAPQATRRNATPHALTLPDLSATLPASGQTPGTVAVWLPPDGTAAALADSVAQNSRAKFPAHLVTYREAADFAPAEYLTRLARNQVRLSMVGSADDAELRIHSSGLTFTGLRLRLGETARFERNYRVGSLCGCGGEWRYFLNILNVYYGPYRQDVFLDRPTYLRQNLDSMR